MRIGELPSRRGSSIRSLRYYEQRGLLESDRSPNGQRIFNESAIECVEQIRKPLDADLSTAKTAELLPCFNAAPEERTELLLVSLLEEQARIQAWIETQTEVLVSLASVIRSVSRSPHTG